MPKSKKSDNDPIRKILRDIVDEFFDVFSDSDDFKEKLTGLIFKKTKFISKLAKELNKTKKKLEEVDD